jgi:hypothetical protein
MTILAVLKVHFEYKIVERVRERTIIYDFAESSAKKKESYEQIDLVTDLSVVSEESKSSISSCETFLKTTTPFISMTNSFNTARNIFYFHEKEIFNRHYHIQKSNDAFYVVVRNDIGSEKENSHAFSEILRVEKSLTLGKSPRINIESGLMTLLQRINTKEQEEKQKEINKYIRLQPNNSWRFFCCSCIDDKEDDREYHRMKSSRKSR